MTDKDANGSTNKDSDVLSFDLNIISKNDAPVISPADNNLISFEEGNAEKLILDGVTLSDPDNADNSQIKPNSAIVQIGTGRIPGEDGLSIKSGFTIPTGLNSSFDATTGTFTVTNSGNATLADLQSLLAKVVYTNTSENPTPGIRNISIKISDDKGFESSQISKNIDVAAANDKPTIDFDGVGSLSDGDAGGALFVSGVHSVNGVEIVPKAKLSDADSMQFTKMLLTLTPHSNHLETIQANSDALSVAESAGVNISSNNAKTTITVSNVASAEIYEKILQNITFKSPINDSDPDGDFTDTRPISVVLTDKDSNPKFDESDGSNL